MTLEYYTKDSLEFEILESDKTSITLLDPDTGGEFSIHAESIEAADEILRWMGYSKIEVQ